MGRILLFVMLLAVAAAGCQASPAPTESAVPAASLPPSVIAPVTAATCTDWQRMPRSERRQLITQVIDSDDLLEGVRTAQQVGPEATRDALIEMAVGSIDKNCMVMRQPAQSIVELARALYR